MAVSYNRLWKLLIDKGITKTEMRKNGYQYKRTCENGQE